MHTTVTVVFLSFIMLLMMSKRCDNDPLFKQATKLAWKYKCRLTEKRRIGFMSSVY